MSKPRATAYILQGRLCVVGVAETKLGPVPFAVSVPVEWPTEGPVDVSGEIPEPISSALTAARPVIKANVDEGRQRLTVENLVLRARQWDQNALAMLGGIRERAEGGDERAILSMRYCREFIRRNPPNKNVVFGVEGRVQGRGDMVRILEEQKSPVGMVICTKVFHEHLPDDTVGRVFADSGMLDAIYEQARQSVKNGSKAEEKVFRGTHSAHVLTLARQGNLKPWCGPMAAWELGLS